MNKDDLLNGDKRFRYMMLSRLESDCKNFLGFGNRELKCLWARNISEQIEAMRLLYNSFDLNERPLWISDSDINLYEEKMLNIEKNRIGACIMANYKEYLIIDYGCGSEIIQVHDLDEAMQYADDKCADSEWVLKICELNGYLLAYRNWCECMDGIEECKNPIRFGNKGYFSDWIIK